MNPFITRNRECYRRWINLLPGFLIPGSAQYLSGRRKAGLIWFMLFLLLGGVSIYLLLKPDSTFSINEFHWFDTVLWSMQIGLIIDACRRPISRIGIMGWLKFFVLFLLLFITPILIIRQFLVQPFKIPTGTMQPTLMGYSKDENGYEQMGDHILVSKTAYLNKTPQRGDIVVFKTSGIDYPHVRKGAYFIKRVVGLPKETISISPPYILADGKRLTEPKVIAAISNKEDGYMGYFLANSPSNDAILTTEQSTLSLEGDEYFVLGDNSRNSLDGRYFGAIKRGSIIGKAFYVYAPSSRKKWIK